MTRQLTFDLPLREARGRADFFVAPANALALASLDSWRHWPGGKMVLTGPPGSGKTHLTHVWAGAAGARVVEAGALPEDLPGLSQAPVAVEGADRIGGTAAETALFHLHNLMAEAGQPLLVTAVGPPRDWGLRLPDLASRMQAAGVARLAPPDDALLAAVMMKLFADRQIAVAPALIQWLVPRMDRSFAAARDLVAALDARALAEARPITRAMAASLMGTPDLFGDLPD